MTTRREVGLCLQTCWRVCWSRLRSIWGGATPSTNLDSLLSQSQTTIMAGRTVERAVKVGTAAVKVALKLVVASTGEAAQAAQVGKGAR